jgi:hypothetical protein
MRRPLVELSLGTLALGELMLLFCLVRPRRPLREAVSGEARSDRYAAATVDRDAPPVIIPRSNPSSVISRFAVRSGRTR